jgi:hypothetical protein
LEDEVEAISRDHLWVILRFVDPRRAAIESRSKGGKTYKDLSEPRLRLEIKAHPDTDHKVLTDLVRTRLTQMKIRPAVMPFTFATGWIQFQWAGIPNEAENEAVSTALVDAINSSVLFKPFEEPSRTKPIEDNRTHCRKCGRPEVGAEAFATCSFCGKPFCFGDMQEHEPRCPKRGEKIKSLDGSELYCSDCREKTPHWVASDMSLRCRRCGHVYTEVKSAK